ncbi:MAG: 3-dehydroquinate synthase family protein, partial [Bacteroidota bacterium]
MKLQVRKKSNFVLVDTIQTTQCNIYIGNDSLSELNNFISKKKYSSVFVLVDENTKKHCLKKLSIDNYQLSIIEIKSGEKNKTIRTCEKIWKELSKQNADRKSLLINLGGGVITDIGGFCASTYKRGIDFINIPTTLLAQVDASAGGKTGIDFLGYKNQIGIFAFPKKVFINPDFLKTLTKREFVSGFAEVIKHGLIADAGYWKKVKDASTPLCVTEEIISRS